LIGDEFGEIGVGEHLARARGAVKYVIIGHGTKRATWPLRVLIEQPSFAAASAGGRRPSSGRTGRGLRWRRLA